MRAALAMVLLAASSLLLVTACPSRNAGSPEPKPWVELFPDSEWDDLPAGTGQVFSGTVRYVPGDPGPTFVMRYNPYKLETGGPGAAGGELLDIYCGGSDVLEPYVGLPVEIEGRLETTDVEGNVFVEIWPARIRTSARTDS
jgi:hypothetical protein